MIVLALGLAIRRPLAKVPENSTEIPVGAFLTGFGVFWCAEGLGAPWPGGDGHSRPGRPLLAGRPWRSPPWPARRRRGSRMDVLRALAATMEDVRRRSVAEPHRAGRRSSAWRRAPAPRTSCSAPPARRIVRAGGSCEAIFVAAVALSRRSEGLRRKVR